MKILLRFAVFAGLGATLLTQTGCSSYWIDVEVQNQTGKEIKELEVDYPTASFGSNGLAAGATMHYRFQIRGEGPIHVQYVSAEGKTLRVEGPALHEHEQGKLTIALLPAGKAQFSPDLRANR